MRSQKRPIPAVERLEPRVTLSVVPPIRQRLRQFISHRHSAALEPVPSTPGSPAPTTQESGRPVTHDAGTIHAAAFGAYTLESHVDGHPIDGGATMHPSGQVAMADSHDPGHFVVSAASLSAPAPPGVMPAHDASGMVMTGASMLSRNLVNMPMNHATAVMPRMMTKHASRPVEPEPGHEPGLGESPVVPHRLDSDLDPDLDPKLDADLELSPSMDGPAPAPLSPRTAPRHDDEAFDPQPVPRDKLESEPGVAQVRPLRGANDSPTAAIASLAAILRLHMMPGRLRIDEPPKRLRGVLGVLRRVRRVLARPIRLAGGRGLTRVPTMRVPAHEGSTDE